jgi:hypothetical protein
MICGVVGIDKSKVGLSLILLRYFALIIPHCVTISKVNEDR